MKFEVGDLVVASRGYLMKNRWDLRMWRDLLDGPWEVKMSFRSRLDGKEWVQVRKGGNLVGLESKFMERWYG